MSDDPFHGRMPTSHERLSGRPWDASYHDGPAPWDIGHPQPAVVRLVAEGRLVAPVLDAGCGTGENALHIASHGVEVLGVDVAESAVAMAREAAVKRGIEVEFAVADALQLAELGRLFATVLDCALFHTFDEQERPRYARSLAAVTAPGGTLHLLCFSDTGPELGPHPISLSDLQSAFSADNSWHVVSVVPDKLLSRYHEHGAAAWFATVTRM